jgi:periplasmic protein TonB
MIKLKRLTMDSKKILSADLLDLVFDNRNKDYGAYELRKNYQIRITKAIVFTGLFVIITFTGVVMANKLKPKEKESFVITSVTLESIPEEEKRDPIPEPPKKIEPPQVQMAKLTQFVIVDDKDVVEPPPTQVELDSSVIGLKTTEGVVADNVLPINDLDDGKKIIEEKLTKESDEPHWIVQVDAKYDGNWGRFLERNLNGEVPINNGAPAGSYTVIIQFVVDVDGSISDIKPLTNHGYGLEQEAIRVIKRSSKWEPAIQNGRQVKAYRKQPITFRVEGEE